MGVSEGGGKTEGTQKGVVVELGFISRDMQGLASWPQVFIVRKEISSWSWLVSLLGKGGVGVYIASNILRSNSFGLKNMDITQYDSMFGVMKDVPDGLWYAGLCLIQGKFAFVVEVATRMITASLEIPILGVESGRHSKWYKMFHNYPLTREISFSYFSILISEA